MPHSNINRLVPPINFCQVEEGLFRSGAPTEINYAFLEELKLKTIVWLAPEDPPDTTSDFAESHSITLHNLGRPEKEQKPWDIISTPRINDALEIMMRTSNHPVLVCCAAGRHRTGTIVGCLRRLQGWNLSSTLDEYRRFTGRVTRLENEIRIEFFDTKAVSLPEDGERADWLWLDTDP